MGLSKLIFSNKTSGDTFDHMVEKITDLTTSYRNDSKVCNLVISTESFGVEEEKILGDIYNNLDARIRSIADDLRISLEDYQIKAATIGGMVATDTRKFFSTKPRISTQNSIVSNVNVVDGYTERPSYALEAYDERENRNSQTFSIVYNLLASRQDDFGETFFPTIVINPTEVGITVSTKLFYVYNDFKRSVTGSLANYGRKNIIRAYANPDIMKNELTRAVPVYRSSGGPDDNTSIFVPTMDVPTWTVPLGNNVTVTTGAIKTGIKIDLIGVSQTNELLNSGIMGPSDTLDTYIKLESIYLKVTDGGNTDIIRLYVDEISSSTFTFSPQGNYRSMILSLDTDSIVLDSSTTNVNSAAPSTLSELTNHKARISINVTGSVFLDKGDLIVNKGTVSLANLVDNSGNIVTGPTFNSLASKIANAEIIGYTIIAYRANSNIRQRGQLLDTQIEYRIIPTLYRSPISVIMPSNISINQDENAYLQTLITATGIRTSNEAVTAILKADTTLKSYKAVPDVNGNLPEISAIGHFYVKPTYFSENIDLSGVVDSIKSHERIKDIRSAIVEKIRFYANEMYRVSEYKAAASVLTGNIGFKPTVIVGTDPVLYNYIMVEGDLRTLGDTFDVKVVSTLDRRVSNKIFITFGVFDSNTNVAVNPLNFGNMLYSAEVPFVGNVSRDGSVSKELIVTPRFLHVVTLPVLTTLTVTGLPNVVNKVTVNMHNV